MVHQITGVVPHPQERGFLGQFRQLVEDVVVDHGLGVAMRHGEFPARGLFAARQAGPDVVF